MQDFSTFIGHHWVLWVLLVILIIALFIVESQGKVKGILQISPQNLVQLMNKEKALVIDVRPEKDFNAGHIIHAQNTQIDTLEGSLKKIQKYKSKPVVLVGQGQGGQAVRAAQQLKQFGFSKVQCLSGGMNAWEKQNYPLIKEKM